MDRQYREFSQTRSSLLPIMGTSTTVRESLGYVLAKQGRTVHGTVSSSSPLHIQFQTAKKRHKRKLSPDLGVPFLHTHTHTHTQPNSFFHLVHYYPSYLFSPFTFLPPGGLTCFLFFLLVFFSYTFFLFHAQKEHSHFL